MNLNSSLARADRTDADWDVHSASLLTAFQRTEYQVMTYPVTTVVIGQPAPALDRYAGNAGWAIVTACNPEAKQRSNQQNRNADRELRAAIQPIQTGTAVKTIHRDVQPNPELRWPDEYGWLFGFDDAEHVHALARRFSQLGVVAGGIDQVTCLWLYSSRWPEPLPDAVRQIH